MSDTAAAVRARVRRLTGVPEQLAALSDEVAGLVVAVTALVSAPDSRADVEAAVRDAAAVHTARIAALEQEVRQLREELAVALQGLGAGVDQLRRSAPSTPVRTPVPPGLAWPEGGITPAQPKRSNGQ